ncbi:hypothetical protein [Nostoc sp. LPT]|uniref:hypothetical protein n=1 Tax=Nostoc sp. LPT TaxID=2815387 RepID=UPI001DB46B0D|nr:hypothetical protein [Nostoc sp. LPT]MBN4004571.1 hypothetical protein [Nostoc sp. LPT]
MIVARSHLINRTPPTPPKRDRICPNFQSCEAIALLPFQPRSHFPTPHLIANLEVRSGAECGLQDRRLIGRVASRQRKPCRGWVSLPQLNLRASERTNPSPTRSPFQQHHLSKTSDRVTYTDVGFRASTQPTGEQSH